MKIFQTQCTQVCFLFNLALFIPNTVLEFQAKLSNKSSTANVMEFLNMLFSVAIAYFRAHILLRHKKLLTVNNRALITKETSKLFLLLYMQINTALWRP